MRPAPREPVAPAVSCIGVRGGRASPSALGGGDACHAPSRTSRTPSFHLKFPALSRRVNCPFYFKIGACRHGERCSRLHNKPTFSQTVLCSNMYQQPVHLMDPAGGLLPG